MLDNLRSGHRSNLSDLPITLIEGSLNDADAVSRAVEGVDYVFHLAAMVSVVETMSQPMACMEMNALGTLLLLEEAAKAGVRKLMMSSTAAVYGDDPALPKREDMLPCPMSPYAISKLAGENFCRMFRELRGLDTTVFRYFNVYGPRQDPASPYSAAIPIFTTRAVANEPITIYGDGQQTRDFVSVKDVVAANRLAMENPLELANVASGEALSVQEIVDTIREITGSSSAVEYAPVRPGEILHSHADISEIRKIGFEPSDGKTALRETIDYFVGG